MKAKNLPKNPPAHVAKLPRRWNKAEIRTRLETSDAWLEAGLLALAKEQTPEELSIGATRQLNGRGFNSFDAEYLTEAAKLVEKSTRPKGARLVGKQLSVVRAKMLKYAGQLADLANEAEHARAQGAFNE